ncbi:hypothetical protein DPMN_077564 [Dreissena polymorpha]|uniref:Gamma-secretase subunit PEN-2 n=1 Tax=Dreissena polymorpha TaxID=45954 RepID=A0A9D4BGR3_DREPO|nr:hypothetical protein DPMN_077564 [Dreissena polymorpha]
MDLKRVKNDEKLNLCRKYYLGGFALLPFLWFVNSVWFFQEAFFKPQYEEQRQIRTYVIRSIIGSIIWIGVIVTWVTIFQLKRADWGATADYMSMVIPKGEA